MSTPRDTTVAGCERCHVNAALPGASLCGACLRAECDKAYRELDAAQKQIVRGQLLIDLGTANEDGLRQQRDKARDEFRALSESIVAAVGDVMPDLNPEVTPAIETVRQLIAIGQGNYAQFQAVKMALQARAEAAEAEVARLRQQLRGDQSKHTGVKYLRDKLQAIWNVLSPDDPFYGQTQAIVSRAGATVMECKVAQAEVARLREALADIADGTKSNPLGTFQEAARYWHSRHKLFVGIARQALAELRTESE